MPVVCFDKKARSMRRKASSARTDVPSTMPLPRREGDDTSHIKRKSGRSMRRNEGSSQHSGSRISPTLTSNHLSNHEHR